MPPSRTAGGRRFEMASALLCAYSAEKIFIIRAKSGSLRAARLCIFTGEVWNELPQAKPDGFASSLWEGASGAPGNFALQPGTVPPCQRPHLRGGCRANARLGEFLRQRLRGRISLLFVPNSTFWGENRKRLSKVHKKAAQSLADAALTVSGRKNLRNNKTNLNAPAPQNESLRKQIK